MERRIKVSTTQYSRRQIKDILWTQQNKIKALKKIKDKKRKFHHSRARTIKGRYRVLVKSAKERNKLIDITFEEYKKIVEGNCCHYCTGTLPPAGGGLDRVDSKKGYILSNVVPCCRRCNILKKDDLYSACELRIINSAFSIVRSELSYEEKEAKMIAALKEYHKEQV